MNSFGHFSFYFLLLCILYSSSSFGEECNCEDLTQFRMEGSTVVINSARTIPEGEIQPGAFGRPVYAGLIPEYCRVDGEIDKRIGHEGKPYAIGFAIAMPKNWNGNFMFQGGGGFNGNVADPMGAQGSGPPALVRGFAVVSSDTGHKSGGTPFDSAFFADQEALMNYLYKAIGKVTVVGKEIVKKYYSKPAKYSYYLGCSTGGREAMIMSQRYPEYYDGIISGAPAMRTNYSKLGTKWMQVSLNQAQPLIETDQKLLLDSFLDACDKNDGVKDEMVFNIKGCNFDPEDLICDGKKTDACLTEKQVRALKQGLAGPVTSCGKQVYSPFLIDTGVNERAFIPGLLVMKDSMFGSPTKDTEMDVDREYLEISDGSAAAGNTFLWTNLSTFSGNGGKLIFYHGVSDPWFSALDTVDYYKRLVRDNGGYNVVSEWSRLFLVPGMAHCYGGEKAVDTFDMISTIVDWVEKGISPESVIASGKSVPGLSRPLCPYPKYPHYNGTGDNKRAENFECREQ